LERIIPKEGVGGVKRQNMYAIVARRRCHFAGIVHAGFRYVIPASKRICGGLVMVLHGYALIVAV